MQAIHLVDPSLPVIEELLKKPIDSYITNGLLSIHHQKGQDVCIERDLQKSLYIAGMGGKEISEIALSLMKQMGRDDRLIVSPHRKILELRSQLQQSDLRLIDEGVTLEDNQYYPYLILSVDPSYPKVHSFGVKIWESDVGGGYLKHLLRHLKDHRDPQSVAFFAYLKGLSP